MVLALPVAGGVVMYWKIEKIMFENAHRANTGLLEQVRQSMDQRIEEVVQLTRQIDKNPKLQWVLMNNGGRESAQDQWKALEFMKELKQYLNANSFISNFFVYVPPSDLSINPELMTDYHIREFGNTKANRRLDPVRLFYRESVSDVPSVLPKDRSAVLLHSPSCGATGSPC